MSDDMSDDLIRYDILTQDALRGVIAKVLEEVASAGLPGDHHFFVTFETAHPGVLLSPRMRERYPQEMTIVIQHSFWNLTVRENLFEIDLSFDDIRERLRVPFAAIKGFYDPSVKFGLQFDVEYSALEEEDDEIGEADIIIAAREDKSTPADSGKAAKSDSGKAAKAESGSNGDDDPGDKPDGGADVVSLDSFRKKNK